MKDKTTLQQLLDMASSVEEEYDRVRKLKSISKSVFETDFHHEHIFVHGPPKQLSNLGNTENTKKEEKPKNLSEALDGSFKKIRNALAKELHPDLNREHDTSEEFKDIQVAFEEGNLTKLLSAADEHDIDVVVTTKDLSAVSMVINAQRDYINKTKSTLEWAWMICSRKNSERQKVWKIIKIKDEEFLQHIEKTGLSLDVMEAQALARRRIGWPEIESLLSPRAPTQKKEKEKSAPTLLLS